MRPMFSYFGSKWRLAKRYGAPRTGLVIEPFAGAACYSLYWNAPKAVLYDINPVVAGVWDYLIHASEKEILRLPVDFDDTSELNIPQEARDFIGFWLTKGNVHPNRSRSTWARQYRDSGDCKVWGDPVRRRVAAQIGNLRGWRVKCASYLDCVNEEADWFIDPPYSVAGKHYPYSVLDYTAVADFCRTRLGRAIVCENKGATWLPFTPFASARATTGKRGARVSEEVVWCSE